MKRSTGLLLLIGGALVLGAVAPRLAYELEKGSWEGQVALAKAIQDGKVIPPCDYRPDNKFGCTRFGQFVPYSGK
jgi:hypothetical protein